MSSRPSNKVCLGASYSAAGWLLVAFAAIFAVSLLVRIIRPPPQKVQTPPRTRD